MSPLTSYPIPRGRLEIIHMPASKVKWIHWVIFIYVFIYNKTDQRKIGRGHMERTGGRQQRAAEEWHMRGAGERKGEK